MNKIEYISASGLKKSRGWTNTKIDRFLTNPDKTVTNPHYSSAPPMKLYDLERVKTVEMTSSFIKHTPTMKQKHGVKKAVRTKINKIIKWAETVNIEYDFPNTTRYIKGSERQKVNHLRHECTSYEYDLDSTFGITGKDIAYPIIKNRILKMIAKRYPELSHEANQQML